MTKKDNRKELARQIASKTTKSFGHRTGYVASDLSGYELDVTSTGILSLDYTLGTGGWPYGFISEVYGPPAIGKSTIIGLGGIREAQRAGKLCGIIAVEPSFDESWAIKNGIDPELLIVAYPDNGEDAFAIAHEWVNEGVPDFIVFDSIGGIGAKAKDPGAVKAFGASGLISANITNLAVPIYKNDIAFIALNQIRADTSARIPGLVKPPGGFALEHFSAIRVHIKPGRDRYYHKVGSGDNASNVLIGRKVVTNIVKNKLAERSAPGFKAQFDFYHMGTDDQPLGLDVGEDITTTALVAGVFEKSGAWLSHPILPGGKLQGAAQVGEFLAENSEAMEAIRKEVLNKIEQGELEKPNLEAVNE